MSAQAVIDPLPALTGRVFACMHATAAATLEERAGAHGGFTQRLSSGD